MRSNNTDESNTIYKPCNNNIKAQIKITYLKKLHNNKTLEIRKMKPILIGNEKQILPKFS